MSYQLSDDAYSRLHQARDAIRLMKHSSLEANQGATLDSALIGNYLTLMDEQLSAIINEAMFSPCGTSSSVQST
jgi:hypothetical protein